MYADRIKFIEYKGKRIMDLNFSNLNPDQTIAMIDELNPIELKEPDGSILAFEDFTNMQFNMKVINAFNKDVKECSQKYKATAMIGITGLVKVMYDTVSKLIKQEVKIFKTREEALEWLITK